MYNIANERAIVYTDRKEDTMASIQPKMSRGHKYWYIVESRRVDGKPRPVVLEYLGKPDDLLKRLRGLPKARSVNGAAFVSSFSPTDSKLPV